jgi:AraC-like DNA-binding protein
LIEQPVFLAQTPDFRETIPMDALSEVLRAVKLRGALFFNGEFSAPWCLHSVQSASAAQYLTSLTGNSAAGTSVPERLIIFHFLTEGRAYARLPDGRREELSSGDIVIVPHGDAHFIGNGTPENAVDSFQTFAKNLTQGLKAAHFGGGGEVTRFVCGFMACEPRLSEVFLASLPPLLKVHVGSEPSGQWLAHSIRFSVDQAGNSSAGSGLVLAKLSEVLFVETLRRYVNTLPAAQTGWLAGARDPVIGRALAHLHRRPSEPWTIEDLARRVGLSRTRLGDRFRHFLGASPMAYLAQWRLKLGAEMLQTADNSVAEVAAAVGYGSEATFNRAFKREFGFPPAQFRRMTRGKTGAAAMTA